MQFLYMVFVHGTGNIRHLLYQSHAAGRMLFMQLIDHQGQVTLFSSFVVSTCKYTVADLEIFRGGFSFTKMPDKLKVKTKKKSSTSFFY